MQTNLNDYDTHASWIPAQNQPYTGQYVASQNGGQQFMRPQNPAPTPRPTGQKPKGLLKMPKAQTMTLANKFKKGVTIASIVGFGVFSGLVSLHQVSTTAAQSTQTSSGSSSTNSSNTSPQSSSQNNNNFFNQQGGNTGGTSSSSSTVTGTHTS